MFREESVNWRQWVRSGGSSWLSSALLYLSIALSLSSPFFFFFFFLFLLIVTAVIAVIAADVVLVVVEPIPEPELKENYENYEMK